MALDKLYQSADVHMADLDHFGKHEPLSEKRHRGKCLFSGRQHEHVSALDRDPGRTFSASVNTDSMLHGRDALSRVRGGEKTKDTRNAPKKPSSMHLKRKTN